MSTQFILRILAFFTMLPLAMDALVLVHDPPEAYRSQKFEVTVSQGDSTYPSFVYEDANQFTQKSSDLTDYNHWTTFAFDGEITVQVKALNAVSIGSCTIFPLAREIEAEVDGQTATFSLSEPAKLFLKIPGFSEHPLFIFADAMEEEPVLPGDEGVIEITPEMTRTEMIDLIKKHVKDRTVYFGPGIFHIEKHFPALSNRTYYLSAGSVLIGSFLGSNANHVKIRGRGVLSGREIEHCGYNQCRFDRVAVHLEGWNATGLVVQGITIIDPGQYCIQAYGGHLVTRNVKCFGWWYETDGWVGGNNSILEDSFFKVNDDVVKVYFSNLRVRDLVIYHQFNGAPFQFGWGGENGSGSVIENIDIVACEVNYSKVWESNRALVCLRRGNTSNHMSNVTFDRIRVDSDVAHLVGINTQGSFKNLILKNITIRGKQKWDSYLKGGTILNVTFQNVFIGDELIRAADQIGLKTDGNVSGVIFGEPPTSAPEAPSDLRVELRPPFSAIITWQDNSDNEEQFILERSTDNATWEKLQTLTSNDTTASEVLIRPAPVYYYRIKAVNIIGESEYSNVAVLHTSTHVDDKSEKKGAFSCALHPVFPNPFNPVAAISYQLSAFGRVRVDVTDTAGRHIQLLVDEEQDAGAYRVEFDGSALPTGVYYCRMISGAFREMRKMVLLK